MNQFIEEVPRNFCQKLPYILYDCSNPPTHITVCFPAKLTRSRTRLPRKLLSSERVSVLGSEELGGCSEKLDVGHTQG